MGVSEINLSEIRNWDIIKGNSKRTNAVFDDSEHLTTSSHFAFAFTMKNVSDLLNFTFTLLDGEGNLIIFPPNKTKIPILSLKIQIIKLIKITLIQLEKLAADFRPLTTKYKKMMKIKQKLLMKHYKF